MPDGHDLRLASQGGDESSTCTEPAPATASASAAAAVQVLRLRRIGQYAWEALQTLPACGPLGQEWPGRSEAARAVVADHSQWPPALALALDSETLMGCCQRARSADSLRGCPEVATSATFDG